MYGKEFKLFQKNNSSIWTDEHISKKLFESHFWEKSNGASRILIVRQETVNWINSKIHKNSRIIDFGCGPGLYAYEFGKLGHKVLGIDFNKKSLNYAKENKSIENMVEYKYCNYLIDNIEGKYDVAMIIYGDFAALIPSEQIIFLQKINNLLESDAILIFDVFGLSSFNMKKEEKNWYISQEDNFWSSEPSFILEEIKLFSEEKVIGNRTYVINQSTGEIKEFILWDSYYNTELLNKLMMENGYNIIEINTELVTNEETLFTIVKRRN